MTTVHVLANPTARAARAAGYVADAVKALRARGADVVELSATTAFEAEQVAAAAVAEGAARLVVVGGDGMVHLAVQAVAQTDTVLGLVPFGSGNDFAGGLGLATDLGAAADAALAAPVPTDLMRIGDRWAASVATAGFSVDVNARANSMRWPRGGRRYTLATLLELPGLTARDYALTVDGTEHQIEATLVTVANTSDFGGGMRITPAADATDGLLDVTVVGPVGRVDLLRWFRRVFDGSHLDHPQVSTFRGAAVSITAPATDVWADGEPVSATPVTIEAVAGALALAGAPARPR